MTKLFLALKYIIPYNHIINNAMTVHVFFHSCRRILIKASPRCSKEKVP